MRMTRMLLLEYRVGRLGEEVDKFLQCAIQGSR